MAEDFQEKTEEPTKKKLSDARKKGFVAKSQDLTISVMLLMTMVVLYFTSGFMFDRLTWICRGILLHLSVDFGEISFVSAWARWGVLQITWIIFPLILSVVFIGILCNLLQTGFIFSTYPLVPKWKKLNMFDPHNYINNFSYHALIRLCFGLARVMVVTVFSFAVIGADMFTIYAIMNKTPFDLLMFVHREAVLVGSSLAIGYLVVAAADLMYQKWRFNKEMKMSRRELKDEFKQTEGDLKVKNKIKEMMQSTVQPYLQKIVPLADVVVTDPFGHFAIALSYRENKMRAPICLAKGTGKKAILILSIAKKHKVFIVENFNLAQSLYRATQVDGLISPEFYFRVAELLIQANKKKEPMQPQPSVN